MKNTLRNSDSESSTLDFRPKTSGCPKFSIKKGLGFWELTFNGQQAILKHEQGLAYVAWLLAHPGESTHAIDLATEIGATSGKHNGVMEITDPGTGERSALGRNARIQERAPSLDGAKVMRSVLRRQNELEALVEEDFQTEPVKAEAYRELSALYNYETRNSARVRDAAAKASDAVGRALKRLQQNLNRARNRDGTPNAVLHAFAEHIRVHILIPSGRGKGHGGVRGSRGDGGFFRYEPVRAVRWEEL
jgi:hypothetical protein